MVLKFESKEFYKRKATSLIVKKIAGGGIKRLPGLLH